VVPVLITENHKMFTQLATLLNDSTIVNLTLAMNKNGTLSVTVIPKPKATGDDAAALTTPLLLVATPEELDEGFVKILGEYVDTHQSLSQQVENTKAILEAAKTESQKKATSAISNSSKTSAAKPSVSEADAEDVEPDDDGGGEGEESGQEVTETATQTTTTEATVPTDSLWG